MKDTQAAPVWMWGIIVTIVVFVVALVLFAVFAFQQDVNLVTDQPTTVFKL